MPKVPRPWPATFPLRDAPGHRGDEWSSWGAPNPSGAPGRVPELPCGVPVARPQGRPTAVREPDRGIAAAGDGEEGIEVVRPHALIKMTNKITNTDSHQNSRSPRRSPSPPSIAAVHLVDLAGRTGDCVPAAPATAPRGLIVVLCGCAPGLPR